MVIVATSKEEFVGVGCKCPSNGRAMAYPPCSLAGGMLLPQQPGEMLDPDGGQSLKHQAG